MRYIIINGSTLDELEKEVNKQAKYGWTPKGSLTIVTFKDEGIFCQAMWK